MTEEARSIADDLRASFDAQDNAEEVAEPTPQLVITDDEPESAPAAVEEDSEAEEATPEGDEPEAAESEADAGEGETTDVDEPPRGLTATQREAWKNTPKEIREAMHKRSEDYSEGIKRYAAQAKKGDTMDQVFTPYRQLFAMNNVQPPVLMDQLLQTASILQLGTPAQKANLLANMAKQFAVDIGQLDDALAGEPVSEAPADPQIQALQREIMQLRQGQQQVQQQSTRAVQEEVDRFASDPKNEFYRDVREDMADWMDLAAKRGKAMTLDEAYQKACENHPDVKRVLDARRAASTVGRKREAASSVHGTPSGGSSKPAGNDIRSQLEWAIDHVGRL